MSDEPTYDQLKIRVHELEKAEHTWENTEARLKESEKKYRSLANNLNVGIYRNTPGSKGKFIEANPAIIRMFGYNNRKDFIKVRVRDLYTNPEKRKLFIDELTRKGSVKNAEVELKKKDGTGFIGSISAVAIKNDNGEIQYFDGAIEDITQRKRNEKQIIHAKNEWERTFDAVSDLIVILDNQHRMVRVNRAMADRLDMTPEQLVGNTCYKCMHGTDHPPASCPHTRLLETGTEQKAEIFEKMLGGKFLVTTSPLFDQTGQLTGSVHTAHDITEQKLKENLQAAQFRLTEYAESHTVTELLQKFLDEAEDLTGSKIGFYHFLEKDQQTLSLQTWSTNTLENMCTAEGSGLHYKVSQAGVWVECVHQFQPVIHNDYNALPHKKGMPDGHADVSRQLVVPVIRGEKIMAILGVGNKPFDYDTHDVEIIQQLADLAWEIVVRRRAETSLRESELKYRSMLESMKDPVYICDPDFTIAYLNPAMTRRIRRNAVGESCFKALHDMDGRCPWCQYDPENFKEYYEQDIVSPKDGRFFHISHSPIEHQNGLASKMTVFRDTTHIKKMEAQLQQSQKMEAMGSLAGGIAHDFNNILSGILGFSQLAIMNLNHKEKAKTDIENIIKGASRAAELVQQILTFSRKNEYEKKHIQLHVVVREVLSLIRSTIPAAIEINEEIYETPTIFADPVQMHQVLMNLCTNAYHAMSDSGGVLTIKLDETARPDPVSNPMDRTLTKKFIEITVRDTGHGMDEKTLVKIFDPYFTTKPRGKGTGLGLAMLHAIIQDHEGHVRVTSRVGEGTTFKIYLPIAREETEKKKKTTVMDGCPTGTESILFVDDESHIREVNQKFLEIHGYQVTVCENGLKAYETFQRAPDAYDMVITDMSMPKMNGDELAVNIKEMRSDMPIILCTGYSEKLNEQSAKGKGITKYIQKPVAGKELGRLVRRILDNPG